MDLLENLSERVSNQSDWFHSNLHLLLLDSVTPLLSPLLGGHRGQGHALLSNLASQLRSIAYEHSIAIVDFYSIYFSHNNVCKQQQMCKTN